MNQKTLRREGEGARRPMAFLRRPLRWMLLLPLAHILIWQVGAFAQAPERAKIAFKSARADTGIWTMNTDGTDATFIVEGGRPTWSPDGRKFAFVTSDGLYIANANGARRRFLLVLPGDISRPAWSPTGESIAFQYRLPPVDAVEQGSDIHVINVDGTHLRNLTNRPDEANRMPAWSPDGRRIAYAAAVRRTDHIWVMDADGANRRRVFGSELKGFDPELPNVLVDPDPWRDVYIFPAWSRNGKWIAFSHQRTVRDFNRGAAGPPPAPPPFQIGMAHTGGGEPRILTQTPGDKYEPTWSPDGTRIAYRSRTRGPWWNGNIHVYDIQANQAVALTDDDVSVTPDWFDPRPYTVSPEGKMVTTWGSLRSDDGR